MKRFKTGIVSLSIAALFVGAIFIAAVSAKDMDGAQVFRDNCTKCHSERSPMEKTDAEWQIVVIHMRTLAGLTAKESKAVLKFLKANNGK